MFTVSNNMIYAKNSRVRQDKLIPSNKEIGFSKYHLPSKFSLIHVNWQTIEFISTLNTILSNSKNHSYYWH